MKSNYCKFSGGVRLAQNTSIGHLVTQPFVIKINDASYNVEPPLILCEFSYYIWFEF